LLNSWAIRDREPFLNVLPQLFHILLLWNGRTQIRFYCVHHPWHQHGLHYPPIFKVGRPFFWLFNGSFHESPFASCAERCLYASRPFVIILPFQLNPSNQASWIMIRIHITGRWSLFDNLDLLLLYFQFFWFLYHGQGIQTFLLVSWKLW